MKKHSLFVVMIFVIPLALMFYGGCKKSTSVIINSPLTDAVWALESIHYSTANVVSVTEAITLTFNEDKTFTMVVACNECGGNYEIVDNQSLIFSGSMACTEVDCGPDSKDDEFHAALATAKDYESTDTYLHLYFADGSYLNFKK